MMASYKCNLCLNRKKKKRNRKERVKSLNWRNCKQIQEQTATEKQNAQAFAEKMIILIEAKTQEIMNKVEL